MTYELDLKGLSPREAYNEASLRRYLSREKGLDESAIRCVRTLRRSIDARQRRVVVNLTVRVYVDEEPEELFAPIVYPGVSGAKSVVVVGAGPAGLFAALRLIELGLRPVVVERGKDVHARKKDIALIRPLQRVSPESNYAFGEGGAGAYSDGKLFTRSRKRGDTEKILRVFVQHGASPAILADAHPHIGTDCLPRVIEHMRQTILQAGGEVHFETRMDDLLIAQGRVVGIRAAEREFRGEAVILATGHSARDVYRLLFRRGLSTEPKGFAVGVRLEHPAALIDQIQYHSREGRGPYLPAAEYSMKAQVAGRGVYSFCMCPGGFVVPAASGEEQLVVNGMSPASRGGRWSNSGMVVEIPPMETSEAGLAFQEALERRAWQEAHESQRAPAQRMTDFVARRSSASLPASSYAPGLTPSRLDEWLPKEVGQRLREAFRVFGQRSKGFLTAEATVIGVETRTSSPVRILRDPLSLAHVSLPGLYPAGEGAGYAGGIVSAAVDGERAAECCALLCFN